MDPMPKQILEHFTHPGHQLEQVHAKTEYNCAGCKTLGKGSSYQCSSKSCYYVLHDYCGTCPPSLPSFMHPHPLTRVVRKPQQSTRQNDPCCDVCREPVEGLFYRCKDCDFNVHPLCTLLPQLLRHPLDQSHPLIFEAPVLPSPCSVCGAECSSWRYRCGVCVLDIHLECLLKPCVPPTQQRSVLPLGPNPNHPPPYPLRPPPPPPYGHPAPYPPPPPSPSPYGHPPPYPHPPPSPSPYGHPPPYPPPPPSPYGHLLPYPPPPPPPPPPLSPYGHPPPYPPPLPYGHPPPYPPPLPSPSPSPSPLPSPSPYGHPPPYLQPPPYGHPPPPPYGGYGYGSGSGSAYGYGNGNGYGVPSGCGDGNGYGVPSGHSDNYNMYNNGNQAQEHGEKFKKFGKRMFLLVAQLTLGVVSNGIFGLAFPTGFSI